MKILLLSRWYPWPADNGSRLRAYHLMKRLGERHQVSLVSFTSEPVSAEQLHAMQAHCVRVETAPYRAFQPARMRAVSGFFASAPRSLVDVYSQTMAGLAQQEFKRFQPDVVLAAQLEMTPYARLLPAPRIFEEAEIATFYDAFRSQGRVWQRARNWMTWRKLVAYYRHLLADFNAYTVVSDEELALIRRATGTSTLGAVIPNGVDVGACAKVEATPEPDTLIYNGAITYQANLDAVRYFVRDILPVIQSKRPATKFYVTGKTSGVDLSGLPKQPGVVFTGYLDDIRSAVASRWASAVPLRIGGGTRLKILEALALGTPVVTTSKGVEGLRVAGPAVRVADTPADFAQAALEVLGGQTARPTWSKAARAAAAPYDWQRIGDDLADLAERVAHARSSRNGQNGKNGQ